MQQAALSIGIVYQPFDLVKVLSRCLAIDAEEKSFRVFVAAVVHEELPVRLRQGQVIVLVRTAQTERGKQGLLFKPTVAKVASPCSKKELLMSRIVGPDSDEVVPQRVDDEAVKFLVLAGASSGNSHSTVCRKSRL